MENRSYHFMSLQILSYFFPLQQKFAKLEIEKNERLGMKLRKDL